MKSVDPKFASMPNSIDRIYDNEASSSWRFFGHILFGRKESTRNASDDDAKRIFVECFKIENRSIKPSIAIYVALTGKDSKENARNRRKAARRKPLRPFKSRPIWTNDSPRLNPSPREMIKEIPTLQASQFGPNKQEEGRRLQTEDWGLRTQDSA